MWTRFMDMHSGGGSKERWEYIFIEAPEKEAKIIFYNRFGHNPDRVTCTCCGEDYSISESHTLAQATGYERCCDYIVPKDNKFISELSKVDQEWYEKNHYVENAEHDTLNIREEAISRGFEIREAYSNAFRPYQTLEKYMQNDDVLFIFADMIKEEERTGDVPEQGYVWAG